jgi:cysteine synthase A
VTFGGKAGTRNIPGIGTSVRPKLADLCNPDRIVVVSEEKVVESCLAFARDFHLLVGGSTGAVLTAIQEMAPEFTPGDSIVAISPDLGEKYLDTIYDKNWVENVIGLKSKAAIKENRSWQPHRDSTSFPARQLSV